MTKKNIKIPFIDCKSDIPLIELSLKNGKVCYAVVDTGSESTVFDTQWVRANKEQFDIQLTDKKMVMVGMKEKTTVPIIFSTADFFPKGTDCKIPLCGMIAELSNIENHFEVNSSPVSVVALIGSDTLTALNATLDFQNQEIIIP